MFITIQPAFLEGCNLSVCHFGANFPSLSYEEMTHYAYDSRVQRGDLANLAEPKYWRERRKALPLEYDFSFEILPACLATCLHCMKH